MTMNNLKEIPIGQFNPTDEEIITYYLRPKVEGEDMTWFSPVISEYHLYNKLPPWVIFQDGGGEDDIGRFFYTRLQKKHDSGEKIHRTVGKNGEYCWDAQDNGNDICDHRTMTVIGRRKQYSLIRYNQKKSSAANSNSNSNNKKRKESSSSSSSSKDDNEVDKSFGHWIMHEYSLVNPCSTSSKDNQNYVLCRIMMKTPPKPTTITTTGNAAIHDHGSINSTVVVPPLAPIGTDYQMNHAHTIEDDHSGYLLQHAYDKQAEELQQLVMLLHDQEQPSPMEEWLAPVVSEWECHGLDDRCGDGSLSSSYHDDQHQILDDNNDINHDRILLVDLTKNLEPLPPIILPKSMVSQEQYYFENKDISSLFSNLSTRMQEEERRVMISLYGRKNKKR